MAQTSENCKLESFHRTIALSNLNLACTSTTRLHVVRWTKDPQQSHSGVRGGLNIRLAQMVLSPQNVRRFANLTSLHPGLDDSTPHNRPYRPRLSRRLPPVLSYTRTFREQLGPHSTPLLVLHDGLSS